MVCGGHAGRAHRKILEKRQKMKPYIKKYESTFSNMFKDGCKCKGDRAGCGCLSDALYKKHTRISLPL